MSIVKTDPAKLQAFTSAARIAELKKFLSDSDYKMLPGYDRPIADLATQRQAWRDEIRAISEQVHRDAQPE